MSARAESEIRSLASRYAQAVGDRDADAWIATWAEDARWEILGKAPEGRDAVLAHWRELMSGIHFVVQIAAEGSIEVDPDGARATARFPTTEFLKLAPDGPGTLMLGTYHDVCVVEDGAWRFARRRIDVKYLGPADLSAKPLAGARG